MRRPTFIILCCIGFIVGVLLGYYFKFDLTIWWLLFVALALVSSVLIKGNIKIIPALMVMVILGLGIITLRIDKIAKTSISYKLFQQTSIEGTVVGDPYWDQERNYVFVVNKLIIDGKASEDSIKVKTFSSFAKEGNRVRLDGKIFPSQAKPGYVMSYAKVAVVDGSQPVMVKIKNKFYEGADIAIGGEPANFIKGVLVGARSSLSKNIQGTLNATGLSHVVAVSGYNLTILVVIFQRLLRKRWAWGSLILSLVFVWIFVVITGGSASILRAAIMASIFLVASYYGRPLSIFVCISLTAVVTLIINPTSIVEDVGWQLSFLSLTGIVVLAPVLQKFLPKKPKLLWEVIVITLAAQIATVPYLLYMFGKYSAVAFLANTLVMPIVPILMLFGFVLSILGLFMPNFAHMIGGILAKAINYIFEFLQALQSIDKLTIQFTPNLAALIIWYACLALIGLVVYHKRIAVSFQKKQELVK